MASHNIMKYVNGNKQEVLGFLKNALAIEAYEEDGLIVAPLHGECKHIPEGSKIVYNAMEDNILVSTL